MGQHSMLQDLESEPTHVPPAHHFLTPWEDFWAAHSPSLIPWSCLSSLPPLSDLWYFPSRAATGPFWWREACNSLDDLRFHQRPRQGSLGKVRVTYVYPVVSEETHGDGHPIPWLAVPQHVGRGQASLAYLLQVLNMYQPRVSSGNHLVRCGLSWWPIGKKDWLLCSPLRYYIFILHWGWKLCSFPWIGR